MKGLLSLSLLMVVSIHLLIGQNKFNSAETAFVSGELLIQLKLDTDPNRIVERVESKFPDFEFKVLKKLSDPMGIWQFTFSDKISNKELKSILKLYPEVLAVQNNHFIKERATTPNDTQYSSQWHHNNDGSNGGTVDADMDTDDAWDITTGGTTEFGSEIVVCILEGGGGDLNHVDLIDNHWYNQGEIADNGIDDDGNGYVDDFEGWDVGSSSDNFAAGGHGTNVAGMIGAKGNNDLGVTGVNWDVKLMMVSGFSVSESSVIEAYSYPLHMRKLYNNSNGTEGAFVVVTNASWGIDGGDPADSPIWCNYYDSLGVYGILNIGATSNSNVNVDQVGDLPTACDSEYMIAVTATNNNDERTFAGYGVTHIDVAAPGETVLMTSSGDSYGTSTGTSFACPATAGAVALMYSIPCASFNALLLSDPREAANQVRDALFNGVDLVASLSNEVKYGGRINIANSVNLLMSACDTSGCLAPYSINANSIVDTSALISWNSLPSINQFDLMISPAGMNTWSSVTVDTNFIWIDTLTACTEYDIQILSLCDTTSSSFSEFTFKTDGCCEFPDNVQGISESENTLSISWSSVLAASTYNLQYRVIGDDWIEVGSVSSPYTLNSLDACTVYEVAVQTDCGNSLTDYSDPIEITTLGCGACLESNYCETKGQNASYEFIENITVAEINRTSGDDEGYLFVEDQSAIFSTVTGSYSINLSPGFGTSGPYDEYFHVWIDFNQDGEFSEDEVVFNEGPTQVMVSGNIQIPSTATLGTTRMRVSMKYNEIQNGACETFAYGEVEDFCVEINNNTGVSDLNKSNIKVYPNPSNGVFLISGNEFQNADLVIRNVLGQTVYFQKNMTKVETVDLSSHAKGVYTISIETKSKILSQLIVLE